VALTIPQSCLLAAVLGVAGTRQRSPLVIGCDAFAPTASLASLQRRFGSAEVGADSVPLGETEGDLVPATVLFPNQPGRRIEIVWKDRTARQSPRYVLLAHGPTEWRTPQGMTIGTSLRGLERLNGRPFHLAGFGFDGSGAVTSWDGGRLAALAGAACRLRVNVDSLGAARTAGSTWYRQVLGDRVFSSGHPAMQALNPRVSKLLLEYP
jgi:hypothetical protein